MRYLLDTNALSESRKIEPGKADPQVALWFMTKDLDDLYLSVGTIFEIQLGILQARRKDRDKSMAIEDWLVSVVQPRFDGRIFSYEPETALICAKLHIPDPRPHTDAMIAATAKQHDLALVTRNTKDFQGMELKLINPWETS